MHVLLRAQKLTKLVQNVVAEKVFARLGAHSLKRFLDIDEHANDFVVELI